MNKRTCVIAIVAILALALAPQTWAQTSGVPGYDIEVYDQATGNNSTSATNGSQVTFVVRIVPSTEATGTCGGTTVHPSACWSLGFTLNWNSAVLSYNTHTVLSGYPGGWAAPTVNTSNPGQFVFGGFTFAGPALASPADVVAVTFDVVGTAGNSTSLTFSGASFGDDQGLAICGTFNNGSVGVPDDYWDAEIDGTLNVVSGPGITVNPTSGLVTTEAGGTDSFTVVLNAAPTADVVIGISSSDTSEGTVSPASLTFTTGNWSTPQTVTVTGVDDAVDDGDIAYTIVTAAATSADPGYNGLDPADVSVTNTDDDTAGITVNPTSGLVTTEAGGTDSFTVVLDTEPTADVTIGLSSSDTSEGTVSPASMTFTAANWNVAQTATVTGVDDAVADGDQAYTIVTAAATSSDANYSGMDPADVAVTNTDDDSPGVTVTPTTVNVAEGGATDSYDVVLNTLPTADVTINITTGGQTTVNPTSLTFTSTNGTTPQTVTVTAVDDAVLEGDHTDTISHTATSGDPDYNNATISDVTANITDNEAAIWLSDDGETPAAGTAADDVVVHEEGATSDTIRVALPVGPTGDVNFTVTSDTQTTVSPTSFTLVDNNQIQDITVTAVDDAIYEGGPGTFHPSSITISATSTDPRFDGASANVTASVEDNEEAPAIPVLGGTGLVLLIGLLTGLGVAILRFRR